MSNPTISEISEEFLEHQSRVSGDGAIKTEVTDVKIIPIEDNWYIRYDCGRPFNEYFAKLKLGTTQSEAFETLYEVVGSNTATIDNLQEPIEIKLSDRSLSGWFHSPSPEVKEIESSVSINGYDGVLSKASTGAEYAVISREDASEVQRNIEKDYALYHSLTDLSESTNSVRIETVDTVSESELQVHLAGFPGDHTLAVSLTLPHINEVSDHPVAEFIRQVGSGRVDELPDQNVYIGPTDHDDVIGVDARFESYGVSSSPVRTDDDSGFFSRFF